MKLGIDFGSTYSTVAQYNPATKDVEALTTGEGEPASIPSVVAISKTGNLFTGVAAKNQIGKRTVRIFEAFKMLINESNQRMLERRGYDAEHTPRYITKCFLEGILRGVMRRKNKESVDKLVICIPEIWSQKLSTLDGRAVLWDVLQNEVDIPIGEVQVVTEPEAASAFIAYNYEKETKKSFNGHLLLIDFGGGTLDLTLTQVTSDGKGTMEIGYREGGGAGENHPDNRGVGAIGKAGIAYMQGVVQLALQDAGLVKDVEYTDPKFVAAVKDLETQLKDHDRMRDIEEAFETLGVGVSYSDCGMILDNDPEPFIEIEYGFEEVSVTYQHLYRAYQNIIEEVLAVELAKINEKTKAHIHGDPCEPGAGARDDFKIAMVGGFSAFYLVKKQIAEIYHLDPDQSVDRRMKNVCADRQEQAISLGAALLAAEKVIRQKTARFSIGIYVPGTRLLRYGIKYHQTIETDAPYFLCMNDSLPDRPGNRVPYVGLPGIEFFAVGHSESQKHGVMTRMNRETMNRIRAQAPDDGCWNVGFSMDNRDVITFHLVSHTMLDDEKPPKHIQIPLDSYSGMFDLQNVVPVRDGESAEDEG